MAFSPSKNKPGETPDAPSSYRSLYVIADCLAMQLLKVQQAYDSLRPAVAQWDEGVDPFLFQRPFPDEPTQSGSQPTNVAIPSGKMFVSSGLRFERLLHATGELRRLRTSDEGNTLVDRLDWIGARAGVAVEERATDTAVQRSLRAILADLIPPAPAPSSFVEALVRRVDRALALIPPVSTTESSGDWPAGLEEPSSSEASRRFRGVWSVLGGVLGSYDVEALRVNIGKERERVLEAMKREERPPTLALVPANEPTLALCVNVAERSVLLGETRYVLTKKTIRFLVALALVQPESVSGTKLGKLLGFAVSRMKETIQKRAPAVASLIIKDGATCSSRLAPHVRMTATGNALTDDESSRVRALAGHAGD